MLLWWAIFCLMKSLIAPWQNKRLHQLLNQLGIEGEEKTALVREFSGTGATSSKELLYSEAGQLITSLEGQTPAHRMRAKLLSMAHEVRWELPDGKVDMARLNGWCGSYGFGKKPLNDYTETELNKLVSQFRILRDNFLRSLTA